MCGLLLPRKYIRATPKHLNFRLVVRIRQGETTLNRTDSHSLKEMWTSCSKRNIDIFCWLIKPNNFATNSRKSEEMNQQGTRYWRLNNHGGREKMNFEQTSASYDQILFFGFWGCDSDRFRKPLSSTTTHGPFASPPTGVMVRFLTKTSLHFQVVWGRKLILPRPR